MNEEHLEFLQHVFDNMLGQAHGQTPDKMLSSLADEYKGRNARNFAAQILPRENAARFPNLSMNRTQLEKFLAHEYDIGNRIAAVLAWGGMTYPNAQLMHHQWNEWCEAVAHLRGESREEDYGLLHTLALQGQGIGPAYFTKLLYFLRPNNDGGVNCCLIMDRWLAQSVNLLSDQGNVVALTHAGYVHHDNSADVYGTFCNLVQDIGDHLGITSEQAEILMFSDEAWRAYVATHA